VVSNETLLTLAREVPRTRETLAAVRGMPRGIVDGRSADIVAAIEAGMAVPDAALPRFPKAPRWERDPDFDGRVARLKAVRDEAAERLALDPGVLCSRERMETVARAKPATLDALLQIPDLRRWQADVLGPAFLRIVAESPAAAASDDSPYRPG
jgi:ribonuclease D